MLKVNSNQSSTTCDSISRRNFLKIGSLGVAGLTLPNLLRAQYNNQTGSTTKSVVWVWLSGGMSHVESTHPLDNAPSEFRSVTGSIPTKINGYRLAGLWNGLASVSDKLAVLQSFGHRNAGHAGGTSWLMSGYDNRDIDNGGQPIKPSLGSIVSRYVGANNPRTGIPTYVRTNGIANDGPVWLGSPYAPFDVGGDGRNNLNLNSSLERLNDRRSLLSSFDTMRRDIDNRGILAGLDAFEGQAYDILLNNVKDAFDLTKEPQHVKNSYGNSSLGSNLLLARRLIERGTKFVSISFGGWDYHSDILNGMSREVPPTDKALTGFINDIYQRGMESDTLLVVATEFGRTSRINGTVGRDHQPGIVPLILSGGIKTGQIIGEADNRAMYSRGRPYGPQNLISSVFQYMGMPLNLQFMNNARPTNMIEEQIVISELF